MLDPRERKRRLRIVMLSGMTGFVLVALLLMLMTPSPHNPVDSHNRWLYIGQVSVAAGLFTMSLTWFMMRRQR